MHWCAAAVSGDGALRKLTSEADRYLRVRERFGRHMIPTCEAPDGPPTVRRSVEHIQALKVQI